MKTELDAKIRRAEFASGMAIAIIVGMSLVSGSFLLGRLMMTARMAAILVIAVLFVAGGFRRGNKSRIMWAAFSVMAVTEAVSLWDELSFLLTADREKLRSLMYYEISEITHSAFIAAAALICAMVYMGMLELKRRSTLLVFIYALMAACALPLTLDLGQTVCNITMILSLCFAPENRLSETRTGRAGRLCITVFPFAAVGAALLMIFSAAILLMAPRSDSDKPAQSALMIYKLLTAAGPVTLILLVLIFPLVLFDKQFTNDINNKEKEETDEKHSDRTHPDP